MKALLIILFLALVIVSVALAVISFNRYKKGKSNKRTLGFVGIGMSILFFGLFIFIPFGITQIETGEIGVVKVWGNAVDLRTSGLHYTNPISTKIETYDLKTQEITETIEAYSLDAQTMNTTVTIQYKIQADKVIEIAREYGSLEVLNERIKAVSVEKTKVILSSKSAMNLIETRGTLSASVEQTVVQNVNKYYVDVSLVVITDISFNDAFENAVEQKMIAEQAKLQAEYDKETAIVKAEQQLEVTKKEAEAAVAKAQGQADAQVAIAEAQAKSIKLKSVEVARTLGYTINEITDPETGVVTDYEIVFPAEATAEEKKVILDYLKYAEYLEKWDGKLPETLVTDGTTSIMVTP